VREGVPVVGFDLGRDPRRISLIAEPEELARVEFVVGDITDLPSVERALEEHGITNVIHLAALQVPFCRADPPRGAQVNVTGTVNVFEAVKRRGSGMAPVVYTGSIGMFSPSDVDPATGRLEEDADAHPGNHYGVYKLANEGSARIYWADSGVPSVGLRPYVVYGPGRDQGMTSAPTLAMEAAARGDGFHIPFGGRAQLHYAPDIARAFVAAARESADGAVAANVGGEVVAMEEVVRAIEAAAPEVAGRITFDDVQLAFPQELRTTRTVEHTPLVEGVRATVERFRARAALP
jgi:nucleoside-diphosphate-sugar epimerase